MTATQVEITAWSPGRLAVSGQLHNADVLLREMNRVARPVSIEFWAHGSFTFSFPEQFRRAVVRVVENLDG